MHEEVRHMATQTLTAELPKEVTKIGNLTEAPTLAFAKESGKPFTKFSVAADQPKVPGDWAGERETTYYRIICFDSVAANACESLKKGDRVIIVGRPEIEEWTDKEGKKRKELRIFANAVGPDLRFATAKVTRVRKGLPETPPADCGDDVEPF
jgi:single-strand DNA-binding protein